MAPDDKLLHICGLYFLVEGQNLCDFYEKSLKTMEKTAPEYRKQEFVRVRD